MWTHTTQTHLSLYLFSKVYFHWPAPLSGNKWTKTALAHSLLDYPAFTISYSYVCVISYSVHVLTTSLVSLLAFQKVWQRRIKLSRIRNRRLLSQNNNKKKGLVSNQRSNSLNCHVSYLQRSSWVVAVWQWSCPACTQSVCDDGPFSGRYPESLGSYSQDTRCPWTLRSPGT